MNRKNTILLIIGACVIILASYLLWGENIVLAPSKDLKIDTEKISNKTLPSKIFVTSQIPGEVVRVSQVTLDNDSWIAVHDDNEGKPGNILGAYFLPKGTHNDQMIPLLRGVTDERSYLVIIHQDNGDRVFDYKIDTPILNEQGLMEISGFSVISESPRGE